MRGVGPAGRKLIAFKERGRSSSARINGGKKDSTGYKVKRKDFDAGQPCELGSAWPWELTANFREPQSLSMMRMW